MEIKLLMDDSEYEKYNEFLQEQVTRQIFMRAELETLKAEIRLLSLGIDCREGDNEEKIVLTLIGQGLKAYCDYDKNRGSIIADLMHWEFPNFEEKE